MVEFAGWWQIDLPVSRCAKLGAIATTASGDPPEMMNDVFAASKGKRSTRQPYDPLVLATVVREALGSPQP